MSLIKKVKKIEVADWDNLVQKTYKRIYSFQQQDDCKDRGVFNLTIPSDETEYDEMNDSIPEIVNGEVMGVKFAKWLERDPEKLIPNQTDDSQLSLFWERNFYPCVYEVANDLHKKGLIEAGDYKININW